MDESRRILRATLILATLAAGLVAGRAHGQTQVQGPDGRIYTYPVYYQAAPAPAPRPQANPSPVYRQTPQANPHPVYPPVVVGAAAAAGDPYGFTAWLNAVRDARGLPAVSYDPGLSAWAAANNAQQAARGMGHWVMGPARRQNSAMGGYASIGPMWLSSPAHASALFDPTIRRIGIAGSGAYWTFNAN